MKISDSSHPILCQKKPWDSNANPIWLASTISLFRNIEKFKFPGKLSSDRKKQIISLISKELLGMEGLNNPYLIKAEEIGFLEKEFISEHFLCLQTYNQAHEGEGFIVDSTGEFLATLNMRDHLHLQLTDCKGELENAWSRLIKIEMNLGKVINYSFLPKFGFLTADPTQCGTALQVSVYLHIPALIHMHQIDQLLEKQGDESISISGIQGSPTDIVGDVLLLQNNYTLGITEENSVSSIRSLTTKLLVEENSCRNKIKRNEANEIKDKISRAFGILIHSYQLEAIEALNALSLIKLGLETNWIQGVDYRQINELFFNCRRAHLQCQYQEKINQEELPHKRAEYIHKTLKDAKLTI